MQPTVDLAPGADSSPLAVFFAERIREGLVDPPRRRVFHALKATVFLVDFDSGDALSFRFDHGRLVIHEGTIGVPTVTFGGPRRALLALSEVRLSDLLRALTGRPPQGPSLVGDGGTRKSVPPPSASASAPSRLDTWELARMASRGELRVYGLLSHPRTVSRFLRIVASAR